MTTLIKANAWAIQPSESRKGPPMATHPIRIIAHILTSHVDRNGNTYTVAEFYNPIKGRNCAVSLRCHSASNARSLAFQAAGGDWENTLCLEMHDIPIRRIQALSKGALYEGTLPAQRALTALMAS